MSTPDKQLSQNSSEQSISDTYNRQGSYILGAGAGLLIGWLSITIGKQPTFSLLIFGIIISVIGINLKITGLYKNK